MDRLKLVTSARFELGGGATAARCDGSGARGCPTLRVRSRCAARAAPSNAGAPAGGLECARPALRQASAGGRRDDAI